MSGEVVTLEAGRKRLAEALEAKERFKRRQVALGLSSAPATSPEALCCMCGKPSIMSLPNLKDLCGVGARNFCPEHTPWPGGIDDMEIGE